MSDPDTGAIRELFKHLDHWESKKHTTVGIEFLRRHFAEAQPVQQPNPRELVDLIADRIGEHPQAFNVFDITDEATTLIKEVGVEELAEFIAPTILAALPISATGEVEWGVRYASGLEFREVNEKEARRLAKHPAKLLRRASAGPWEEVTG